MKAQVLNLQQGTAEWHDHRANHYNASDASAMMGASSYKSRAQLIEEKATGIKPEIDQFTQRRFDQGHEYEAMARPWAEEIIGAELYPTTIAADVHGLPLSASLDGLTMDEKTSWEHKSLNDNLRESLVRGEIPPEYHYQMEQGLLLSGATRCLFMASNGDKDSMMYAWYERNIETAKALIAGWKQFQADVENYVPQEKKTEAVAQAIRGLPALNIRVTGSVTTSNLAEYQRAASDYIAGINTELETDQDFANAEADIKFCSEAEKKLRQTKTDALSQTVEIDDLMKTIDYIAEELRQKRLILEKLVKSEKQNRKIQIADKARQAYQEHVAELESELGGLKLTTAPTITWNDVLKGLRTIDSLQNAADTALAQAKIGANEEASRYRANLATLAKAGDKYAHLFADLQQIIDKAEDDFASIVKLRCYDEDQRIEAAKQAEIESAKRAEEEAAKRAEEEAAKRAEEEARKREGETTPAPEAAQVPPEAPADPAPETTQAPEEPIQYPYQEEVISGTSTLPQVDTEALLSDLTQWRDKNRVSKKAMQQLYDLIYDHFKVHVI